MMKTRILSPLILGLTSLALSSSVCFAQSLQTPENQTFFTGQPPSLISAETLTSSINWPDSHYYFIFNLPKNSVESVGKIIIQQQPNVETIQFNLSNTYAFRGTQNSPGQALKFKVNQDPKTQAITILFDPPIPPGNTFSIRLEANQNPSSSGVYLFNVNAFPFGNNAMGMDMGVGRLSFYQTF